MTIENKGKNKQKGKFCAKMRMGKGETLYRSEKYVEKNRKCSKLGT